MGGALETRRLRVVVVVVVVVVFFCIVFKFYTFRND